MSLLTKSKQNYSAFLSLKEYGNVSDSPDKKCNSPAVHCCYYSCFQKAVHILKEFFPDKYELINLKDKGTHNSAVNYFLGEVKGHLSDSENLAILNRSLVQLKTLRIKCDYSEDLITDSELETAEVLLRKFHQIILKELSI